MLITKIQIFQAPLKLKKPFVISLSTHHFAENIFIKLTDSEGFIGYGECCPFKSINGEFMTAAFEIGKILGENLLNKEILDGEKLHQILDASIYGNSSIKSAFDVAFYDILAQKAQLPLYKYLGGDLKKAIYTDFTVSIGDSNQMAADAKKIVAEGFQILKIKLGGSVEDDFKRISAIRKKVGNEIPIRIDANQGWSLEDAKRILKLLEPLDIQHCEEPIPRWQFMDLKDLQNTTTIPIMADESCCDHNDAQRLISLQSCPMFNVKLGKSAGLFKATKILNIALENNIECQIGGFLESRLTFTANAHLANTVNSVKHFDFDSPLLLVDDPIEGGICYQKNGQVTLNDTIGIGAKVNEMYLMNCITHCIE